MKFKRLLFIAFTISLFNSAFGQKDLASEDSIASYFEEIKNATSKHEQLWNKDLYGPILLVDPKTRQLFSNFPDKSGVLKQYGKIYSGILPFEVNIANTSTNWNGRDWAMIMLPLPKNKENRINLLAHELFHLNQQSLGFKLFNIDNNHLDQKNGRIYLRLELEALKKALLSKNKLDCNKHLNNALIFRKYRYLLFKDAEDSENLLELNEGLAEYSGLSITGRTKASTQKHFEKSISSFLNNPTFVRSFAYHTVPIYGYILSEVNPKWNQEVSVKTNLADFFIKKFLFSIPADLKKAVDLISVQYDSEKIALEELEREQKAKRRIEEIKSKYIQQSHFEINFEQMQVSFNPGNIMPIEESGTFYPNMRISDNWGVLTVSDGALMSKNWSKVSITIPSKFDNSTISGEGWTLELKNDYTILKDEISGNYILSKR